MSVKNFIWNWKLVENFFFFISFLDLPHGQAKELDFREIQTVNHFFSQIKWHSNNNSRKNLPDLTVNLETREAVSFILNYHLTRS